mgnify:CR=1 FL=1
MKRTLIGLMVLGLVACSDDAPPKPAPKPAVPPHNAAMDCRACHGVSAPLPHVDNGDDCNTCHH